MCRPSTKRLITTALHSAVVLAIFMQCSLWSSADMERWSARERTPVFDLFIGRNSIAETLRGSRWKINKTWCIQSKFSAAVDVQMARRRATRGLETTRNQRLVFLLKMWSEYGRSWGEVCSDKLADISLLLRTVCSELYNLIWITIRLKFKLRKNFVTRTRLVVYG